MCSIIKGRLGADQVRSDFFFKPDFDLIGKSLEKRQGLYDTNSAALSSVDAKLSEVQALEGYDKKRYHEKSETHRNRINEIKGLFGGDLSKAGAELTGFVNEVGLDFGIHGEYTAIGNRYTSAMKNYEELKKRRDENKITEAQFHMWSRELGRTAEIGIGKDKKSWNSWKTVQQTDAVDRDKFLGDFMRVKEKELRESGYRPIKRNGKIEYYNDKHEFISYDTLMEEASKALRNAMDKTGELNAEYLYHLDKNGMKEASLKPITSNLEMTAKTLIDQIEGLQTLTGRELQAKINEIYGVERIVMDSKIGPEVLKHQKVLLERLTQQYNDVQTRLDYYSNITDPAMINSVYYNHFSDKFIRSISDPYVQAKSFDRHSQDMKVTDDIFVKASLDRDNIKYQHQLNMAAIEYQHQLANPKEIGQGFSGVTEGIQTIGDVTGNTLEDAANKLNGIKSNKEKISSGLLTQLFGGEAPDSMINKYLGELKKSDPATFAKIDAMMKLTGQQPSSLINNNEIIRNGFLNYLGLNSIDDLANVRLRSDNMGTFLQIVGNDGKIKKEIKTPGNITQGALNEYVSQMQTLNDDERLINQRRREIENGVLSNPEYKFTTAEAATIRALQALGGQDAVNNIVRNEFSPDKIKEAVKKYNDNVVFPNMESMRYDEKTNTITINKPKSIGGKGSKSISLSNITDISELRIKLSMIALATGKQNNQILDMFNLNGDVRALLDSKNNEVLNRYQNAVRKEYEESAKRKAEMSWSTDPMYFGLNAEVGTVIRKEFNDFLSKEANALALSGITAGSTTPQTVATILKQSGYKDGKPLSIGEAKMIISSASGNMAHRSFVLPVSFVNNEGIKVSKEVIIPLKEVNNGSFEAAAKTGGAQLSQILEKHRVSNLDNALVINPENPNNINLMGAHYKINSATGRLELDPDSNLYSLTYNNINEQYYSDKSDTRKPYATLQRKQRNPDGTLSNAGQPIIMSQDEASAFAVTHFNQQLYQGIMSQYNIPIIPITRKNNKEKVVVSNYAIAYNILNDVYPFVNHEGVNVKGKLTPEQAIPLLNEVGVSTSQAQHLLRVRAEDYKFETAKFRQGGVLQGSQPMNINVTGGGIPTSSGSTRYRYERGANNTGIGSLPSHKDIED